MGTRTPSPWWGRSEGATEGKDSEQHPERREASALVRTVFPSVIPHVRSVPGFKGKLVRVPTDGDPPLHVLGCVSQG